jgi:ABC-type transporter MlaC component
LYHATDGWKVYDVSVVGISLVKTYHITIAGELKQHGIDSVIAQINAKSPLRKAGPGAFPDPPPAG